MTTHDPSGGVEAVAKQQEVTATPTRQLARRWVRSTRTDVRFDPLTPYDLWADLGARIGVYANGASWWLGDWLAFGQMKYGRRYRDAIAATGLDYQTLRNYAVVARRFAPDRRRRDVSFQHHAEICALSEHEQDRWLDLAASSGWSRNELRRRVRASLQAEGDEASAVVRLTVDAERARRWRDAAELTAPSFDAWALGVLDTAAASALQGPARAAPARPRSSRRRDTTNVVAG